jgi:hypothetical protein
MHVQPLIYQAVLQHLLDLVFVVLCEQGEDRLLHLSNNLERVKRMLEP